MRATPDVARAGPTSARRRRERRIRSFFRHEQLAVQMAVVSAQHHSAQRCCSVATQTGDEVPATTAASPMVGYVDPAPVSPAPVFEYVAPTPAVTYAAPSPVVEYVAPTPAVTYAAPSPVVGYVAPTPAVTYAAPAPVIGYVAPAPSVTSSAPAPVFEYVMPAPVSGFIAPAPAGSFVAPSQQLRPAYTDDAAVEVSASQVVGSLPHGEVFAAPVFHQVHHVPLAGGEILENLVEIPVDPEQVIPLRVVDSLPHAEEFTAYVARRPPPLVDVRPSSRAQRLIMEDLGGLAPLVQILDLPVPQTVDSVMEVLRFLDLPLAEQAISVPKISCSSCPSRACVPEPQLADQLVEVPTVLTPSHIALLNAEQIVDNPVDDDYGLLLVFCENCEFLVKRRNEWQSQGHGVAKLLWHSEDLVFFQFWQEEQLIIADVVRRVGAPPLVLRPARGQGQRTWVWSVPDLADGLSHAVRFASHELGRRFHDEWEPTL